MKNEKLLTKLTDFRNFLYLTWKHLNLPEPTKIQYDIADYIANGFKSGEQFVYLMKDVGEKDFLGTGCGTWFYSESIYTENGKYTEGPFKPLEIDPVKDHINILKRSYKVGEVA